MCIAGLTDDCCLLLQECCFLQDAKREVEAARDAVKELHTRKAAIASAISAAVEKAASAMRRLPKLEADKRVAAAAKVRLALLMPKEEAFS